MWSFSHIPRDETKRLELTPPPTVTPSPSSPPVTVLPPVITPPPILPTPTHTPILPTPAVSSAAPAAAEYVPVPFGGTPIVDTRPVCRDGKDCRQYYLDAAHSKVMQHPTSQLEGNTFVDTVHACLQSDIGVVWYGVWMIYRGDITKTSFSFTNPRLGIITRDGCDHNPTRTASWQTRCVQRFSSCWS
jgi:hypothetical protein